MSWFTEMFGVVPTLPARCSMTDREWNSRQNRWKRRYPNLEAWLAAHRNDAAGRLIGTMPPVVYYTTEKGVPGWRWRRTDEHGHDCTLYASETEISLEEYRAKIDAARKYGLTEREAATRGVYVPIPDHGEKPVWPPMPERYLEKPKRKPAAKKKAAGPQTKTDALVEIIRLMAAHGITADDLGAKPKPVNGYRGRYDALAVQLRGTSVTLPPFEAWVERVRANGG